MIPEWLIGLFSLLGGILLGGIFFGGLLWTTRKALGSRSPGLWFAASFLIRLGLALAGFYLISGAQPIRLALCLAGFLTARILLVRRLRSQSRESGIKPIVYEHQP